MIKIFLNSLSKLFGMKSTEYFEVLGKISPILKNAAELELDQIKGNQKLLDIGINSIKLIQAIVEIEQECELIFRDEDLIAEDFITVKDLVRYIIKLKSMDSND